MWEFHFFSCNYLKVTCTYVSYFNVTMETTVCILNYSKSQVSQRCYLPSGLYNDLWTLLRYSIYFKFYFLCVFCLRGRGCLLFEEEAGWKYENAVVLWETGSSIWSVWLRHGPRICLLIETIGFTHSWAWWGPSVASEDNWFQVSGIKMPLIFVDPAHTSFALRSRAVPQEWMLYQSLVFLKPPPRGEHPSQAVLSLSEDHCI